MRRFGIALLLGLFFVGGVAAMADDAPPDAAVVRKQIDELIAAAPNHRATLGRLHAAMALSISFGAPAWNAHDHEGCADFYIKTGESLVSAFAAKDNATAPARKVLDNLKSALDKVKQSNDVEANAWTMRFVFDKTGALLSSEADRSARMMALGLEVMGRSQFDDAVDAFSEAVDSLHELEGEPLEEIPLECRFTPLVQADALFARKHYKEAAAAVEEGLRFCPDVPDKDVDLSKHFADPAVYKLLLEDLRDAAEKNPKDAGIQMLTGYQLYFTGQKEKAKPFFEKTLELEPRDAGAKRMMEQYDPNHKAPAAPADPQPQA